MNKTPAQHLNAQRENATKDKNKQHKENKETKKKAYFVAFFPGYA